MKKLVVVLMLAWLPTPAAAAEGLDWAYPVTPKPEPLDNVLLKRMPGSEKQYTQAQIDDPFNPPDWHPGDHPPMPPVVANGVKPAVRACAMCHLTSGDGHPESSGLAGLPAAYIIRQMADFKNGHRKGVRSGNMITFAQAIQEDDTRAAAEYFASLKPRPRAKTFAAAGDMPPSRAASKRLDGKGRGPLPRAAMAADSGLSPPRTNSSASEPDSRT